MPRLNTPVASRPLAYDRNPVTGSVISASRITEDSVSVVQWTYTVPSDTKARLNAIYLAVLCEVAATSTTTTDEVNIQFELQPNGGAFADILYARLNTPAMAAGDRQTEPFSPNAVLIAGDAVRAITLFTGDAAGAGVVQMQSTLIRTQFDA